MYIRTSSFEIQVLPRKQNNIVTAKLFTLKLLRDLSQMTSHPMAFGDNESQFGHGSAALITGQPGLIVHSPLTMNSAEGSQRAEEVCIGSPPKRTRPTQPMSEKPAKTSPQRPGVHCRPRSRPPSVHANHDGLGELDALRHQSSRDQAYVTHLATVLASLEKQVAETKAAAERLAVEREAENKLWVWPWGA